MYQSLQSGTRRSGLVPLCFLLQILLIGGLMGDAAPASGAADPRAVLLVTLDGARADLAARERSLPELAALAREGVSFANATAPTAMTFPATVSLMTGLYPHHNGVQDEFRAPLKQDAETLARRLSAEGWKTAGFPGDYLSHARSGIANGFDAFLLESPELSDSARVDSVLAFLRRGGKDKVFAWAGFTFAAEQPLWERYLGSGAADSSAYLARARAIDIQIGRLRAGLQEMGALPRALVIVIGTHGEVVPGWRLPMDPAGETPLPGHGMDLSEDAVRVPWVMRLPDGSPSAKRVLTAADGWVSTIDLLPTVLEMTGAKPPQGVDGISLVSAIAGAPLAPRVLFHEADLKRTLGWAPRYAARGTAAKVLLYGARAAIRPVGASVGNAYEKEGSNLLSALTGEFKIGRSDLKLPAAPDTLFGSEDREIRLLMDVRPTAGRLNPNALTLLADYTQRYPQNVLFQVEQSLFDIFARREQDAAGRLDAILKERPDLVELEGVYAEHLLFFSRYDVLISRFQSLSGYPMFDADRIWRLGAAHVAAGEPQEASRTYLLASKIASPPEERWRRFQEDAPFIAALRAEIKVYPDRINSYLRLGAYLWNLGLLDQGYVQFQQGRAHAPGLAEPEYQLGHYLALEGRAKNAIGALLRAVEKDPKHLAARIELANAQLQTGERDAALANLQTAVATGDVDEQVHYNLACLLAQKGEKDAALRELAAAVQKGYSNRTLLESDPDLAPLRDDPRYREILARMP